VSTKIEKTVNIPALRSYLLNGEFFIGTALANCLVKLALRFKQVVGVGKLTNAFLAESMIILTSILHLGKSKLINQTINEDDYERIALCLMILTNICSENGINADIQYLLNAIFLAEMRSSLDSMLSSNKSEQEEAKNELRAKKNKCVESDDHLSFSQLMSKNSETLENQFDVSLSQAIGGNVGPTATTALGQKGSNVADLLSASKLSKVTQLTGFSDPVYAECYVNVNQYDICLDVLIVNQSSDTLQNCTLELATLGDLKLVEKPQPLVLAPHDFANIKASVKVASTENGIIFGNIGKTFDNFTQYFMKDLLIEISYQLFILKFMTFPVRHQIEM
jgi:coatomer subunit beta